jgi:hypothetical protein
MYKNTSEVHKRQKYKNYALLFALIFFIISLFVVTLIKIKANIPI